MTVRSDQPVRIRSSGVTIFDQAVSSLTNLGASVIVAKASSVEEFGAFGVVFVGYLLALGVSNALVVEPYVVHRSRDEDPLPGQLRTLLRAAGLGAVAGLPMLLLGFAFWAGELRSIAVVAGVGLPILVAHEALRVTSVANGAPRVALAADVAWLLTIVATGTVVLATGTTSGALATAIWVIGAFVGLAAGGWLTLRGKRACLGRSKGMFGGRRYKLSLLSDFLIMSFATYSAPYVVGLREGLSGLASLRAGQLAFGPVLLAVTGSRLLVLPLVAELAARKQRLLPATLGRITAVLGLLVAMWGAALYLLPSSLGRALFGDVWLESRVLLAGLTIAMVGRALAMTPSVVARVAGHHRALLLARLTDAATTLTGVVVGSYWGGAVGMVWGWAVANCVAAAAWWIVASVGDRRLTHLREGMNV